MPLNTSGGPATVRGAYIDPGREARFTTQDSDNIRDFTHDNLNPPEARTRQRAPRTPRRPDSHPSRPSQANFSDPDSESDGSDENIAQGHRTQTRGRQEMDEDAILEQARRIQERRAARARRRHERSQSAHTPPDIIDPTRHPGSYAQPPFPHYPPEHVDPPYSNSYGQPAHSRGNPDHIRGTNPPYNQTAPPYFPPANSDHIRSTNPYNQPAPPHFPPPGNSDPFRSNPYSQPAPPARGNTYPYNPPAHPPFSHGHLDPHRSNSNPYDQPIHHYQSNSGQFPPPSLSNAHREPTARNPRNSFASQVTPQQASDPTPQLWRRD